MQEHKNDYTCTGEHYSLFVVRHVATARLDSLDTLVSTRSTKSNVSSRVVSSRVETSQVEFGPYSSRRWTARAHIRRGCSMFLKRVNELLMWRRFRASQRLMY